MDPHGQNDFYLLRQFNKKKPIENLTKKPKRFLKTSKASNVWFIAYISVEISHIVDYLLHISRNFLKSDKNIVGHLVLKNICTLYKSTYLTHLCRITKLILLTSCISC